MEPSKGKTSGTSGSENVSTKLRRIAELARKAPEMALTTLAHHIDVDLLLAAWLKTRKDGAAGVDGIEAKEYAGDLEELTKKLQDLLERFKSGRYKAPPVRRAHIPKAEGRKTRPIGVPTFEDKILQRAVVMVLEAVYEQDFLDCNYGFRRGRSAHGAIQALWERLMEVGGGIVLEVDIQAFFDTLDHGHLRTFLDRRMRDGVLRRMIDKWLKAGVLEGGRWSRPKSGTPQGGVVSPLLANIYLHEVLDRWFEAEVKPRLSGKAFLIRFADDFVIVFSDGGDARRVWEVLPKRFGKYGLTLHPEKSRLVNFRRPRRSGGRFQLDRKHRPESFDFLGFTHFWDLARKGYPVVRRKTARSRLRRTLKALNIWLRDHRHLPIPEQHRALVSKLRGHDAYFGITGNDRPLRGVRHTVRRLWRKWLSRRSQKAYLNWDAMLGILSRFPLPRPRAVRSVYPRAANP